MATTATSVQISRIPSHSDVWNKIEVHKKFKFGTPILNGSVYKVQGHDEALHSSGTKCTIIQVVV